MTYMIGAFIKDLKPNIPPIHLHFPKGYFPRDMILKDEPDFPQTLYQLGTEYIINNIEVLCVNVNKCNVIVNYELNVQLNYNQRYMLLCNLSWELEKLNNLVFERSEIVINSAQSAVHFVVNLLISNERGPGDFGQEKDLSKIMSPDDFGLEEME